MYDQKLSVGLQSNHHVIVRFFGDAKTRCTKNYIKPTMNQSFYHIILHFGTHKLLVKENSEFLPKLNLQRKRKPRQIYCQFPKLFPLMTNLI